MLLKFSRLSVTHWDLFVYKKICEICTLENKGQTRNTPKLHEMLVVQTPVDMRKQSLKFTLSFAYFKIGWYFTIVQITENLELKI